MRFPTIACRVDRVHALRRLALPFLIAAPFALAACTTPDPSNAHADSAADARQREVDLGHDDCSPDGSSKTVDVNGDQRPDIVHVMKEGREVCRIVDLNFDGAVDVYIYYDAKGGERRREADFDRDGRPDLVYRNHVTQKISVWLMNGTAFAAARTPSPDQAVNANWEIVGAQDWNGDGDTDFLWYNPSSGKIVLWFMDGDLVRVTGQFTDPPNAGANNWKVLAMGDYGVGAGGQGGSIDLVWRNATSGRFVAWYMDHAGHRTAGVFTSPDAPSPDPTGWSIVGPR